MSHLVPCTGCARHVRSSESRCPFCDAALPELRGASPRPAPATRLSRAATYALGTALGASLAAAAACGDGGAQVAAYGGPPTQDDTTGGEVTTGGGDDAGAPSPDADAGVAETDPVPPGSIVALYGAPVAPPAQDPGGPAAAYGGPPTQGPGLVGPRH